MEGRPIEQGDVDPPTQPYFMSRTNPQIPNNQGGYVYKLDDMERLRRFLIIGAEKTLFCGEKRLSRENAACVDRLIAAGRGVEVVQKIKEVSLKRQNIRQDSLLMAYAICARSDDRNTKTAAYALLSEICRIPTHLFMFIQFCEDESRGENAERGTGWGRAHKRAVCKWYSRFEQNPEKLARLITKYRARERWSHKDVFRLTHISTEDQIMRFINCYIIHGCAKAIQQYDQTVLEMDENTKARFQNISKLIKEIDEASCCQHVDQLCALIREHKLTWEQCNSNLLRRREVWQALLPHMPKEALIRNLGRMTSCGMFAPNSEEEQQVLDKINTINIPSDAVAQRVNENPESDSEEMEDEGPWMRRSNYKNIVQPMKILLAWKTYKAGKGDRGHQNWTPNQRITGALEEAFYRGFVTVEPTGKIFYLAVNVSESMNQHARGRSSRNISCAEAAAAMMMIPARTEENCIIKAFSDKPKDLDISATDTLEQVLNRVQNVQSEYTDCAQPIIDAMDMKKKDIDVFVIYTDNETWYGKVHPHEALLQYRKYSGNPEVKLIVCGMRATKFTIADKEDPYMLDIVGYDCNAPWIISEFARGRL